MTPSQVLPLPGASVPIRTAGGTRIPQQLTSRARPRVPSTRRGVRLQTSADDAVPGVPGLGTLVGVDHSPDPEADHTENADQNDDEEEACDVADEYADALATFAIHQRSKPRYEE